MGAAVAVLKSQLPWISEQRLISTRTECTVRVSTVCPCFLSFCFVPFCRRLQILSSQPFECRGYDMRIPVPPHALLYNFFLQRPFCVQLNLAAYPLITRETMRGKQFQFQFLVLLPRGSVCPGLFRPRWYACTVTIFR